MSEHVQRLSERDVLTSLSPLTPSSMNWSEYYPAYVVPQESPSEDIPKKISQDVEVADIGCGFGGLLVGLAPKLPESLLLGREKSIT